MGNANSVVMNRSQPQGQTLQAHPQGTQPIIYMQSLGWAPNIGGYYQGFSKHAVSIPG